MPDKNLNLNNGGTEPTAEEKAAQEAKAATDKKAADDKAAADKKAADDKIAVDAAKAAGEETITIKKSDWEKTNQDLDNYRTGLINKKKNERDLGGDNNAGAGDGTTMDAKKVEEIATKASMATIHKKNEKSAIAQFLKKNPDYVDDAQWQSLLLHLPANINRDEETSIVDALEGAVLLHKRSTGKLDEHLAAQREAARHQAEIDANVNVGHGAGGVGNKVNSDNGQKQATESTVEMGKNFGHDAAKIEETLKEIPKTSEGFVFDITKPKPSKK